LRPAPMALLREDFAPRGYLRTAALRDIPSGRIIQTAGIVLIRQRPGTASGVIFSTLEDARGAGENDNCLMTISSRRRYRGDATFIESRQAFSVEPLAAMQCGP
jgi:hypothetical protein